MALSKLSVCVSRRGSTCLKVALGTLLASSWSRYAFARVVIVGVESDLLHLDVLSGFWCVLAVHHLVVEYACDTG